MDTCEMMDEMIDSTWLRSSLIANLSMAIVSIPVLLTALRYISAHKLFHQNTRIQIKVHIFGLLIHSFGRISLHSLDLINYFTHSGCDALPDFYRCFITRGIYNIGLALAPMCSIALVIERSIALVYSSSYEMCGKTFGILLAIFQVLLTFLFLSKLYLNALFTPDPNIVLYYCQTLASGRGSVWSINAPLYSVMIAQCVCRIVFAYLEVRTKKLRTSQKQQSLSTRYTLEQGIRSIKALNVFINVNFFVFFFLSFVGTTLHFNSANMARPTYFALVEVIHFLPLYGILLSFFIYHSLRILDKKLKASLSKSINVNPNSYFIEFNRQIG